MGEARERFVMGWTTWEQVSRREMSCRVFGKALVERDRLAVMRNGEEEHPGPKQAARAGVRSVVQRRAGLAVLGRFDPLWMWRILRRSTPRCTEPRWTEAAPCVSPF